nr:reverse transcriptase domain-containing protein [Tanacetum cinerariifolium]
MADQRTMAQLLQASTEGYEDAIVVLRITADNFELKHGLLTLVQNKQFFRHDKEDPHAHIRYFNKITSTLKFPNVPNTACPHHGFSKLHQLDTFYNALNLKDQDSLNSATDGNFLDKMPRECLAIIESKSKVHYSRNKPVVAKVSMNTSTFGISPDVAGLKDMLKALLLDKKSLKQAPATVKAVEESYVTCGVNYNQGNTSYHPPMMSNQIRPLSFPAVPNNQNVQLNQRNNQNYFNQNQNQENNFNHGPVYQPSVFQPPAYQAPSYQAPAPQTQGVSNASTSSSGTLPNNTIANPRSDLKANTTRSGVSYNGPQIPPPPSFLPKIFKDMSFEISFADALILMPKFASTLKALIENKEKLSEIARTQLNVHYSAVLLKKLPEKLGDPSKFPIPCDFPGMEECLALADLDASINLMPLFVWKRLSLPKLTPTCMTLELADRSISRPIGVAEDVYVKVGTFHFSADFVVVDFDADPRVHLILRRSFLNTRRALIDVFEGKITLCVGKEVITLNLDQTSRYSVNYNDMTAKRIDVIHMSCEEYSQEVLNFSNVIASGNPTPYYEPIVSTTSSTLTPFRNSDFLLEEVDTFLALEYDPTSPEAFLNDDPSLPPPKSRKLSA